MTDHQPMFADAGDPENPQLTIYGAHVVRARTNLTHALMNTQEGEDPALIDLVRQLCADENIAVEDLVLASVGELIAAYIYLELELGNYLAARIDECNCVIAKGQA